MFRNTPTTPFLLLYPYLRPYFFNLHYYVRCTIVPQLPLGEIGPTLMVVRKALIDCSTGNPDLTFTLSILKSDLPVIATLHKVDRPKGIQKWWRPLTLLDLCDFAIGDQVIRKGYERESYQIACMIISIRWIHLWDWLLLVKAFHYLSHFLPLFLLECLCHLKEYLTFDATELIFTSWNLLLANVCILAIENLSIEYKVLYSSLHKLIVGLVCLNFVFRSQFFMCNINFLS